MKVVRDCFLMLIPLAILLCLGATKDFRAFDKPVAKVDFTQLSVASGGHVAVTGTANNVNMYLERIDVGVSDVNDSLTATLTLTDENGTQLVSLTGITEDAFTLYTSTGATPDFNAVAINNTLTVSVDPNMDPNDGAGETLTIDVILYGR